MKHVREPLPDVQRRRPEVSASLAAVVEHATAKETKQPLRDRRGHGARPRGGAGHRGRPLGRDQRRGHDRPARPAGRHGRLRAPAPAQPPPLGPHPAARGPGGGGRGALLLRQPHREGAGRRRDPARRRADARAARARAPRTTTTRRATTAESPSRPRTRSTATRPPSGTPSATTTDSRAWTRTAWACTWTPARRSPARPWTSQRPRRASPPPTYAANSVPDTSTAGARLSRDTEVGERTPDPAATPGTRDFRHYLVWITDPARGQQGGDPELTLFR